MLEWEATFKLIVWCLLGFVGTFASYSYPPQVTSRIIAPPHMVVQSFQSSIIIKISTLLHMSTFVVPILIQRKAGILANRLESSQSYLQGPGGTPFSTKSINILTMYSSTYRPTDRTQYVRVLLLSQS